jgi:hypothetical protein
MTNNQKDIKKTGINYSPIDGEKSNVPYVKSLSDMSIYEFANKKTEKLVTALYLVSDCMDTDDAIKGKLRLLGVELLSDIYKLSVVSQIEKNAHVSVSLVHIYELLSFIEVAYTIGFISEMNMIILKKEFLLLASNLKASQEKEKNFTFTLDNKMFDLPELSNFKQGVDYVGGQYIKDMSAFAGKRTSFNTMSYTDNKSPLQNFSKQIPRPSSAILSDRKDRTDKILSLIKDKKEISIKDISLVFTDCSEKTIQRELNSLVAKGQLNKTGAKRWSRYAII